MPKPSKVGKLIEANKQEIREHKNIFLLIFFASIKNEK